jgi:hypothetical protein
MQILSAVVCIVAVASWLFALVCWIRALSHRAEGVTLGSLLFHGIRSFDKRSFTPEGQRHQRGFLIGFCLFGVCIFVMIGISAFLR